MDERIQDQKRDIESLTLQIKEVHSHHQEEAVFRLARCGMPIECRWEQAAFLKYIFCVCVCVCPRAEQKDDAISRLSTQEAAALAALGAAEEKQGDLQRQLEETKARNVALEADNKSLDSKIAALETTAKERDSTGTQQLEVWCATRGGRRERKEREMTRDVHLSIHFA